MTTCHLVRASIQNFEEYLLDPIAGFWDFRMVQGRTEKVCTFICYLFYISCQAFLDFTDFTELAFPENKTDAKNSTCTSITIELYYLGVIRSVIQMSERGGSKILRILSAQFTEFMDAPIIGKSRNPYKPLQEKH